METSTMFEEWKRVLFGQKGLGESISLRLVLYHPPSGLAAYRREEHPTPSHYGFGTALLPFLASLTSQLEYTNLEPCQNPTRLKCLPCQLFGVMHYQEYSSKKLVEGTSELPKDTFRH